MFVFTEALIDQVQAQCLLRCCIMVWATIESIIVVIVSITSRDRHSFSLLPTNTLCIFRGLTSDFRSLKLQICPEAIGLKVRMGTGLLVVGWG